MSSKKGIPVATIKKPEKVSFVTWLMQIWGDFNKQHGDLAAAAVAVFGLLSLVPTFLLACWAFVLYEGKVTGLQGDAADTAAWETLKQPLRNMLAGSTATGADNPLLQAVHGMLNSHTSAGIVGMIGLAWAGSRIFNIITETFDESWQIEQGRNFIKQNLVSLAMLIALGLIFGLSIVAGAATSFFVKFFGAYFPVNVAGILGSLASIVVNLLTSIALFVVLYKWAPNRKVAWKAALFGGVIGGILWAIFQQAFRIYLDHFNSYNKAYGTLGAFVILILWAYYSAYILILGNNAAAVYSERVLGQRGPDASTEPGGKIKAAKGQENSAKAKGDRLAGNARKPGR